MKNLIYICRGNYEISNEKLLYISRRTKSDRALTARGLMGYLSCFYK